METEDLADEDRLQPSLAISRLEIEATTNKSLTLTAIKLDGFRGIYSRRLSPLNIIKLIAEACEVEIEFKDHDTVIVKKKNEIKTTHRQTLYINKVAICDGAGKTPHNAHTRCASNALKYLKGKGLAIISPEDVDETETMVISKEELCENGDDLRMVQQCVEEKIDAFLKDENFLLIVFSSDLDKYEREVIEKLAVEKKLRHTIRGTGNLVTWKNNNKIHTMAALPEVEDITASSEEKEKVKYTLLYIN